MFKQFIFGDEILAIEQFQKDYGYNQGIGIYDKDYIEADGQDYGDITFTDSEINVVYFNQLDEKYKNQLYMEQIKSVHTVVDLHQWLL